MMLGANSLPVAAHKPKIAFLTLTIVARDRNCPDSEDIPMEQNIRWGILGTGGIAKKFALGLESVPDATLTAVGSRSPDKAETFARQFNIPHAHPTYEDLAGDPDVDVIYIATPHPFHMDNTLLCISGQKAVLCEKPFAVNAAQAKKMANAAADKSVFLMEAMWTRFFPAMANIRRYLEERLIGDVRMLTADFGFVGDTDPNGRLFNADLAGGALLDVGIYPISLASMVFGKQPSQIATLAHIGKTGVDEQSAVIFKYDAGRLAILCSSVTAKMPGEANIIGSKGCLKIHAPFWRSDTVTISRDGEDDQIVKTPVTGNGYNYEITAVNTALRNRSLQCDVMGLDETIQIMQTMDKIREKWQLKYPCE